MKKSLGNLLLVGLFLSSCLAEQDNPFLLDGSTCTDGIQNQNEEGVDCGGICEACEVIEPVVAPCKASLTNNRITVDGIDYNLTSNDYSCTQESEYYEIFIMKGGMEITIEVYEPSLPTIGTMFPLQHWSYSDPGYASIKIIQFYSYNSNAGELYVSYENNKYVIEFCSVTLNGNSIQREITGRIVCD